MWGTGVVTKHAELQRFSRKRDRPSEDATKAEKVDEALLSIMKKDRKPIDVALTALQKAYKDSNANACLIKDLLEIIEKFVLKEINTGTAENDSI